MIGFVNIWGIFTAIFLVLGISQWKMSGKSIPNLNIRERPFSQSGSIKTLGSDLDQPLKDFAEDFNKRLDYYNKESREQHMLQAAGYFVASGTTIASMISIAI